MYKMGYYENILKNTVIKEDAVILGIESSCDETAASIVKGGREILSNVIISSATEHVKYGGVVPEIASRMHTVAINNAVERAFKEADIPFGQVDAIAVTYGAGLLGALLVGVSYAKALAFALNKPLIPVSHIRGHLSAAYLADKNLQPPFIGLIASGGHTAIIAVKDWVEFGILGSTLDDAVGEAFDKVARLLHLPYPGGPNIEKLASGGKNCIPFTKMLKGEDSLDFSYSGLKTQVANYVHNAEQRGIEINKADVACSFQTAAVEAIVERLIKAVQKTGIKRIAAGGGVVANGFLRESITKACKERDISLILPEKKYCTDNAAMIASEGFIQYKMRNFSDLTLNAVASMPLGKKGVQKCRK